MNLVMQFQACSHRRCRFAISDSQVRQRSANDNRWSASRCLPRLSPSSQFAANDLVAMVLKSEQFSTDAHLPTAHDMVCFKFGACAEGCCMLAPHVQAARQAFRQRARNLTNGWDLGISIPAPFFLRALERVTANGRILARGRTNFRTAFAKPTAMPAKCHGQTSFPKNNDTLREQVVRWSVFPASAMHKSRQSQSQG